jgi:hypothetical protein
MTFGLRLEITRTNLFGRVTDKRAVALDGGGIFPEALIEPIIFNADLIQIDHAPEAKGTTRLGLRKLPFFGRNHYEVKGVEATEDQPGELVQWCHDFGKVRVKVSRINLEQASNEPIFVDH